MVAEVLRPILECPEVHVRDDVQMLGCLVEVERARDIVQRDEWPPPSSNLRENQIELS